MHNTVLCLKSNNMITWLVTVAVQKCDRRIEYGQPSQWKQDCDGNTTSTTKQAQILLFWTSIQPLRIEKPNLWTPFAISKNNPFSLGNICIPWCILAHSKSPTYIHEIAEIESLKHQWWVFGIWICAPKPQHAEVDHISGARNRPQQETDENE